MSHVLVACNSYAGKAYALPQWAAAYRAFTYAERDAFMVDNTAGTLAYAHDVRREGIPAVHVEPLPSFWDTIEIGYAEIARRAEWLNATHVLSVEADVVCPPQTIEVLLTALGSDSLVSHRVPWRGPDETAGSGCWSLGCCLVTTARLRHTADLARDHMEGELFDPPGVELDGLLDIAHLYDADEPEWSGKGSGK